MGGTTPSLQGKQQRQISEAMVSGYLCECTHLSADALTYSLFGKPELAHSLASMCVKLYCIVLKSECRVNVARNVK